MCLCLPRSRETQCMLPEGLGYFTVAVIKHKSQGIFKKEGFTWGVQSQRDGSPPPPWWRSMAEGRRHDAGAAARARGVQVGSDTVTDSIVLREGNNERKAVQSGTQKALPGQVPNHLKTKTS